MFSFWPRKAVAEQIGSTAATSAIFGLAHAARKAGRENAGAEGRVVLIGHSLGGGILLNSVSQSLAYEYIRAQSDYSLNEGKSFTELKSPADLILLINPAIESVYLRQLRVSIQPQQAEAVYPWLVSLTAETDWVTKYLFPLAHMLRVGSNPRKPPYWEMDWSKAQSADTKPSAVPQGIYARRTPGHNPFMRDFRVTVKRYDERETGKPQSEDVIAYSMEYGSYAYIPLKNRDGLPWFAYFNENRPKETLHPLFWVATVDSAIMNGHKIPFDDPERRDNFVGTIMALMHNSPVVYGEVKSSVTVESAVADPRAQTQVPLFETRSKQNY
jgi:hypothetical protein